MKLMPDFKTKSLGFYIVCVAAFIGLVTAITYLAFGISSSTFSAGIFFCLLIATLAGASVIFYDGQITDILVLAMVVLLAISLGLQINDSAGDFTEYLTPVGMYGNAANMGARFAIAAMTIIAILVGIVGCFFRRVKKTA